MKMIQCSESRARNEYSYLGTVFPSREQSSLHCSQPLPKGRRQHVWGRGVVPAAVAWVFVRSFRFLADAPRGDLVSEPSRAFRVHVSICFCYMNMPWLSLSFCEGSRQADQPNRSKRDQTAPRAALLASSCSSMPWSFLRRAPTLLRLMATRASPSPSTSSRVGYSQETIPLSGNLLD